MSIWISRPWRLLPAALLAGCVGLGGGSGGVAVTSDAITIAGPRGFCVDPDATRDLGTQAFVLLGNCAAISESRLSRQPVEPALLTAAVSEPGAPDGIAAALSGLPEFFASEDGQAVLSRSGDADTVEVIQTFVEGDVFYLNATDSSEDTVPGVRDDYWRAYFDLGPRIVTLSVLALDGSDIGDDTSLNLLSSFVAAVRAANPAGAPDAETGASRPGLFNSGLFQGILGPRGQ